MRLEVDFTQSVVQPPPVGEHVTYAPDVDEAKSKDLLSHGIRAAQAGDRAGARASLLSAVELDPKCENGWLWLASISEYPEELMAFLDNVLAINPENERALQWKAATETLLSKTYVQRGKDAAEADQAMYAEDCFRKALQYDQENAAAWLWLASLSKDPIERVAYLERVLAIEPDNTAAINALETIKTDERNNEFANIRLGAAEGRTDEAAQLLQVFNEKNPSHVEGWMLLSHIAVKPADKLAALERVLEIDPENQAARVSFDSLSTLFAVPEPPKIVFDQPTVEVQGEEPEPVEHVEQELAPVEELARVEHVEEELVSVEERASVEQITEEMTFVEEADNEVVVGSAEYEAPIMAPAESFDQEPEEQGFDPFQTCTNVQVPAEHAYQESDHPIAPPNEELVFEPISESPVAHEEVENESMFLTEEVDNEIRVSEPDWDRETEAYEATEMVEVMEEPATFAKEFGDAPDLTFSIPMPDEIPFEEEILLAERTGFETTVEPNVVSEKAVQNCPYCASELEMTAFVCNSCCAALTLSDLEMLLNNSNADRYAIRVAVERMEAERKSRDFSEAELTALGIGHLNLRNLQFGFEYLQEASQLNPDNIMLASQVNSLLIRMEEIRRQDEVHASMTKGKTILVVDDSATIRKLIAGKLEKCGHEVFLSCDGVEAMEQLQEFIPDLILLDITMPRMDGYEVCRQIRGRVATAHVPVVMISGKDGFFDKVRGRLAGTTGYITKPFGPETLMKAIEFYLGGGQDYEESHMHAEVANVEHEAISPE